MWLKLVKKLCEAPKALVLMNVKFQMHVRWLLASVVDTEEET
jgi:hypothetical protein